VPWKTGGCPSERCLRGLLMRNTPQRNVFRDKCSTALSLAPWAFAQVAPPWQPSRFLKSSTLKR